MLFFFLKRRLKDLIDTFVQSVQKFMQEMCFSHGQSRAPAFKAQRPPFSTALPRSSRWNLTINCKVLPLLAGPQKLSYQIKCYLWTNTNSLSAEARKQTQGNSCLYSHILARLQWFQTLYLACFSLQCIPYYYPPRGHFTLCSPASLILLCCIKLYGK